MQLSPMIQSGFEAAKQAKGHTYSPYSKFPVGAALKLKGLEQFFLGCNVENASYGATICAERSAIVSAIGKVGKREFEFLVVTANTEKEVQPCALCLQVLAEFAPANFQIYLGNKDAIQRVVTLGELLPNPFNTIPQTK